MSLTDTLTIANGTKIPQIGFGTWQSEGNDAYTSVLAALKAGYRHIDTAAAYGNEDQVGQAIKDSGIARTELFVTTKLWNDFHSYEDAKEQFAISLKKLQLDYVDLYLIHWPRPIKFHADWKTANAATWKAFEEFYAAGTAKAIGVANFGPKHLDALLKTAKVAPMVNQIFLNPSDLEPEVVAYNKEHNILTEAYSPFGTGKLFALSELTQIGEKHGKTAAQVALRWSIQHGFIPLPKSVHEDRIIANTNIFDFQLDAADMQTLDDLHGQSGLAMDPDTIKF